MAQPSTGSSKATASDPNASTGSSGPQGVNELLKEVASLDAPLSLPQKLVQALILVLNGLQQSVDASEASPPSGSSPLPPITLHGPPVPGAFPLAEQGGEEGDQGQHKDCLIPSLSTSQYSQLLEILASALKDASAMPWLWSSEMLGPVPSIGPGAAATAAASAVAGSAFNELHAYGLDVPLDYCDPFLSPSMGILSSEVLDAAAGVSGAAQDRSSAVKEVPALLLENLNDLVKLLRPSSTLTDAEPSSSPALAVTAPSSPRPFSPESDAARPPINTLPAEMLSRILLQAKLLKDVSSCECEHACVSSKSATQRWSLSLQLVCKDWKTAARRAAYSHVRIRKRNQVSALVELIKGNPELGEYIAEADIKVAAIISNAVAGSSAANGAAFLGHPRSSRRGAAFPWLHVPEKRSQASNEKENEDNQLISSLVDCCPAIAKLELNISKPGFSSYSWAIGPDFLESGLEHSLGAATCLRTLVMRTCIDYGELEAILLNCSTIEVLRLESGVDNLDGADDAMEEPHKCRLREFTIQSWETSDIGEQQLCWILRPSIGTLSRLEVATSVALTAAGLAGGNPFPPFNSYHFAQVLVQLAPTLVRLALKDSLGQAMGLGQTNPSLRAPPHDGFFDYALERCHKLRELALEWTYTGSNFLSSLAGKPLTALALLGQPTSHTSAKDLANRVTAVESDCGFPALERLALAHFPLHHAQTGWSARDVRYLRRACNERDLSFEFSTI